MGEILGHESETAQAAGSAPGARECAIIGAQGACGVGYRTAPLCDKARTRDDPTDRDRGRLREETNVAKFKVVTPGGASYSAPAADYKPEMEALTPIDAEIVEVAAKTDEEFVKEARDADALYAKGRRITKRLIDGLERCKVISLGSVGVDSVDVDAATARGIPVTNVPDTFIEEVADHAMMLILATYRRLTTMDRMVREGRWSEGRPLLYQFPRLMGQTLGLIAFGHVARAVAVRARAFGFHILAYDPYVEELVISQYGVEPVNLTELLQRSDIVSMHAPATADAHHMMKEHHFRLMKPEALYISTGRGPTTDESALIKALKEAGSPRPASTCSSRSHPTRTIPCSRWTTSSSRRTRPRPPRGSTPSAGAASVRSWRSS